jgi:dipeptide transport system substrate-binding protein
MRLKHWWVVLLQAFGLWIFNFGYVLAQPIYVPQKLVFCSEGNPESLAPNLSFSATSIDIYSAIFDTLVTYARGETNLRPSLAEHWQISNDGKEYTFFLQRGVKWHSNAFFQPTRNFNADDVIFTIERQWKADHPYHHVTSSNHVYFNAVGFGALVKSMVKVDDFVIKFTLNEPNAAFLSMLTLSFAGIQSQEYAMSMLAKNAPEMIDTHPIGTGPFSFVSYEKDQKVVFKTFLEYWRGRAKIDELEFLITPSATERWQKLQNNVCHVMPYPNPNDLVSMRSHPNVTVLEQAGLNVGYLAYNTTKVPFNDLRVRKALNMAINKSAILNRVFQGTGVQAINPVPPTMWSHNKNVKDDVFDPRAAKQLLKEAGFPNGFSTDLWVMPIARAYNPNPLLMGQMIQADLAAIGVRAEIKSPEWHEYLKRMAHGEHQMGLLGWTTEQGDPDAFFYTLLSCEVAKTNSTNVAKFCHQRYNDLILRARAIANPTLRIPLYEEAQLIFKEQAPWLTIAHSNQLVVVRNEVSNFRLSPFGWHLFYGIELKP